MNIAIIFGRKNSKGLPNKNIRKILGKPAFLYPVEAALGSKKIRKVFVSSDSDLINRACKKKGCEIIPRPEKLATDESLLSDAINYNIQIISDKYKKISNIVILLCNSVCVNPNIIDSALNLIEKKDVDTVTTISKFNMFSPVRAVKINNDKIINFIPNNILKKFTNLSGDRDNSTDSYFITHSCTISKISVLKNMNKNPMPFKWMGKKKSYLIQNDCVGDIDFQWQLDVAKAWLKKNGKKN